MLRFQEKKSFKRYVYSPVSLILVGIVILIVMHAVYGVYRKAQSAGVFLGEANAKLAEMKEREMYFSNEIERLNSDLGIEEEIRKKFQVAKEGEKVIVIVDEEKNNEVPVAGLKTTIWQKLLGIF